MLKKISVIALLLATSFADQSLITNQLFWDTNSAYDYATRIMSHPEVPTLPNLNIKNYAVLQNLVKELRLKRSDAVIYANAVKIGSLRMQKLLPKILNNLLGWFDKGYKKDINNLVKTDYEIRELHKKIMEFDLSEFFNLVSSSQDLSEFSGRIFIDGVSFNTLSIDSKKFTSVYGFSPFLMFDPSEPGCYINYFEDGEIPLYIKNEYFSSVTALCNFDTFYSQEDLKRMGKLWYTDFSLVEERIKFLDDFTKFLNQANIEVSKRESKFDVDVEEARYFVSELKKIQKLLVNSSVKYALLEISTESKLVANEIEFMPFDFSHDKKLQEYMDSIKLSKNIGQKFKTINEATSYIHNLNSETSLSLNGIESKIQTMEKLCILYKSPCSFTGDLSLRLLLTSRAFLDARINYLKQSGMTKESNELSLNEIIAEIENSKELISEIEEFTEPKDVVVYVDEISKFEVESKLVNEINELNSLKVKILNFQNDVTNNFFEENIEEARKIKAELLSLSEFLEFEVFDLPLSIQKDPVKNLIYYLSKSQYLDKAKENYEEKLVDFSSKIPSKVVCIPTLPLLGESFEVKCRVIVNNTYGVFFENANTVINLPYTPSSLNSKNFIGDTQNLKSVSFSSDKVRLNLQNLGKLAVFETTYDAKPYHVKLSCGYTYGGMNANFTCAVFPTCNFSGIVKLLHPFSGKEMSSNLNYTYDGKYVYFEASCGEVTSVVFSGPSVELSEDDGLIVKSLINSTQTNTITLEVEHPKGYNASLSFNLGPYEEKKFDVDSIIPQTNNDTKNHKNETLNTKDVLLDSAPVFEFGCIEDVVLESVLSKHKFDKPRCLVVKKLKEINKLYNSGDVLGASRAYQKFLTPPELEVYLKKSSDYFERSTYLINQLDSVNGVTSGFIGEYKEKAKTAYEAKDYLVAAIYAQYGLMKSTINLKFDPRVIVALIILGYGLYASKKQKEKEELI